MTDTIQYSAGWGTAAARMSPSLRNRVEQADRAYEQQAAAEERERAARQEQFQTHAITAAMDAAVLRGEAVSISETWRTGGANVGRTRGEALAYFSAVQDLEDARLRRRAQQEIDQVGVSTFYESWSADTSAPTEADQEATRAERAKLDARYSSRARDHHTRTIARGVVETHERQQLERRLLARWSA